MWPFRRNQTTDTANVPPEVQDYYEQGQPKQRVGLAWLLALGTLIVTVGVALSAFFGGRWVYHKVQHKPTAQKPTTTQTATTNQPSTNQPSTPQVSVNPPATSSTSNQPSTSQNGQSTTAPQNSQTGTTDNQLPHTGPADNVAIVLGAVILSTAGYQLVLRRRAQA